MPNKLNTSSILETTIDTAVGLDAAGRVITPIDARLLAKLVAQHLGA